jgi:hypothetical protein
VRTGREEEKFEKRENNFVTAKKKNSLQKKYFSLQKIAPISSRNFMGLKKAKATSLEGEICM